MKLFYHHLIGELPSNEFQQLGCTDLEWDYGRKSNARLHPTLVTDYCPPTFLSEREGRNEVVSDIQVRDTNRSSHSYCPSTRWKFFYRYLQRQAAKNRFLPWFSSLFVFDVTSIFGKRCHVLDLRGLSSTRQLVLELVLRH